MRHITQTTKRNFIIAGVSIIVIAFIISFSIKGDEGNKEKMLKVESDTFKTSTGWGYNILVDHKIFIHQEYIPAIAGKKSFLNKEDAVKTASFVIQKLLKTKLPTITSQEVSALNISQ